MDYTYRVVLDGGWFFFNRTRPTLLLLLSIRLLRTSQVTSISDASAIHRDVIPDLCPRSLFQQIPPSIGRVIIDNNYVKEIKMKVTT